MANASARKTLLVGEGTGQRAGRGFVTLMTLTNSEAAVMDCERRSTWLFAIEAEPFFSTVGATRRSKAERDVKGDNVRKVANSIN